MAPEISTGAQIDQLVVSARALAQAAATSGKRYILGISGPPGAGKSTLSAALEAALDGDAVVIPMDGFHLPNSVLEERGLGNVKGAPNTFDVEGYAALLARLRPPVPREQGGLGTQHTAEVVLAPKFNRGAEAPEPDAIAVSPGVPLVITEGNYLLHDQDGWEKIRPLLDAVWHLDVPRQEVQRRLVARRISHGHAEDAAEAWVHDVDLPNYDTVQANKHRADTIITLA